MANHTAFRFFRGVRSLCAPITCVICFSLMLTYVFILYQPTPGPGIVQRLGWQSWENVSPSTGVLGSAGSTDVPTGSSDNSTHDGVDWWDVTSSGDSVDFSSLPLDVWAPLLPHDTGLSELSVTSCLIDPNMAPELCAPDTTAEQDAIKGNWVRVERDLNLEAGYLSSFLSIYYRRPRRKDVNLVTDIRLLPKDESPDGKHWHKATVSLRAGVRKAHPLYLWYKLGKTAKEMSAEERNDLVTEIDVLYGDDTPWYGFDKLEPATLITNGHTENTWITVRRGVKIPPKAPPLHFSHSGNFKILQVADLHYSVSQGYCRDVDFSPCEASDNLTNTLLGNIMDVEKPDLLVFTGDQLNGQSTSWDPKSVLAKFAKAATERKVPWSAVFGNHDSEVGLTRSEQMDLMKGLPYSHVQKGPTDIHGVGNYVLKVKSADASKTHLLTLYFLDSGDYDKGYYNFWGVFTPTSYDYIRQSQIDWFLQESASIKPISRPFSPDTGKDFGDLWDSEEKRQEDQVTPTSSKLAKPNALMFFHIPLPESYSPADTNPQTGELLDVGIHGKEGAGNAKGSDKFFDKGIRKALESEHTSGKDEKEVKVIANGHCHLTENCRRVKGVWLCFGGGGSFSGYGKVGFDRRFRIYDISNYGENIVTYKRTEKDEVIDRMVLVGKGAPSL